VSAISRSRRRLYAVLTLTLLAASAEGICRQVWSVEDAALNPKLAHLTDHPTQLWIPHRGRTNDTTVGGMSLTTNQLGLRDDPITDPAPRTRILSMGESTTWGHGVAAEETYSQRLEAKLRADGHDAEVINAGIERWSIWQSYVFLAEQGRALAPDAVMLYHLHSDSLPRGVRDTDSFFIEVAQTDRELYLRRHPYRHVLGLLYKSRAYLMLRRSVRGLPRVHSDTVPVADGQPRVPRADRQAALAGIAALCQSMGAVLVVMMPVYQDHAPRDDTLTDFAQSTGAKYLDLAMEKSAQRIPDAGFFLDPHHPTAAGHAHIADWIHSNIAEEPWIH
jgi:lysophospholipase L1-like esterase